MAITQQGLIEAFRIFLEDDLPLGDLYIGLVAQPAFLTPFDRFDNKTWTEFTGYSEKTRPKWNRDNVDGQVVPNIKEKYSVFTLTTDVILEGIFITDDNTKGGLTGNILAVSDPVALQYFSPDKILVQYDWNF